MSVTRMMIHEVASIKVTEKVIFPPDSDALKMVDILLTLDNGEQFEITAFHDDRNTFPKIILES